MAGAYKFIKENNIGAGKTMGVLFADSSRNYMSKFMDDAGSLAVRAGSLPNP